MGELEDQELAGLIGAEVAWRRKAAGLSMREFGALAGMSQPFLSQLERGLSLPSMTSVYKLAHALDVAPGDLLPELRPTVTVVRKGEGRRLPLTESSRDMGTRALLLADDLPLTVLEHLITPDDKIEEWYETPGEAGLLVLEGRVAVEIRGQAEVCLDEGDFLHLSAGTQNRWRLGSTASARLIYVISTAPSDGTATPGDRFWLAKFGATAPE